MVSSDRTEVCPLTGYCTVCPNLTQPRIWLAALNRTLPPMDELGFTLTFYNPGYHQSHRTELHQPTDEFGVCFNLTQPLITSIALNRTPPSHGWVYVCPKLNLTLDMVSHAQHNATNPRMIGCLPWPNLTLDGQSHSTELHQHPIENHSSMGDKALFFWLAISRVRLG
jgi:hypothetical protein